MFLVVWATLRRMWLSEASVSLSALVLLGALAIKELRARAASCVLEFKMWFHRSDCLPLYLSMNKKQVLDEMA